MPSSESGEEDDPLYIDQDDAQSFMQPSLSPEATRLTSPRTPAAEKAAAMERLQGGGLFDVIEGSAISGPVPSSVEQASGSARGLSLGQLPTSPYRFPSPWQAGPKQLVIQDDRETRPFSGIAGHARDRSSSSGGNDALKRIREAFPSINLPPNFFSGLTSPTFFSGSSGHKNQTPDPKRSTLALDGSAESRQAAPLNSAKPEVQVTPPSTSRPRTVRRSTSDESMLYHSLSRVSSFGDDNRWGHIREQTNSRLKAIKDSWDRPTFKMPQLPDFLPAPLKKTSDSMSSPGLPHIGSAPRDGTMSDLDQALESLTGDVVIMGGYRGSILRSTKTNRQVWVPVKVGLNIRKVNLEVGLDPEDEERMEENIYASGMLQNIGPVDISKRLFKRLRECDNAKSGKLRVWDYGWDWRLSPRLLSRKLISFLEQLPSNQASQQGDRGATVIAHSLGGLITRHAVNQRPELFAGIIYAGTPKTCINILGPIRNGDAVLLNEKVLTAQVNFSLRTTFVFLPEDGFCFINKNNGEQFPVDFYDPKEWAKYCLSPCIEPALPPYTARQSSLGSLLNLGNSLPSLPLRTRGNSSASETRRPPSPRNVAADATRRAEVQNDHTIAPQMGTKHNNTRAQQQQGPENITTRNKSMEYLTRTLAETKQFRAELAHQPRFTEANLYPPMAVMYGKDTPTVYAAHVPCREAIACADVYDNLLFQSGDGVVLARQAMLPEGFDVVKGGRVSTDRGHITILGDLEAVGRALGAVVRGRQKGIGLGLQGHGGEATSQRGNPAMRNEV
ncbi:uncharacterized protein BCR38DRAFT_384426 [Pseudomassariella vexata]|uniref:Lecithin:cholesterol acyltransferase-domain-containing protein n=1 Tax=Pseudomassariella vexata TaxID=1141098 RepID=A0A1Y2EF71_9PEZI|nr:uncharacterized protein BCR38DRAFT_384426 [Pseudomassariella vexata]ORY69916.1 hypothetical protein BCR38DRAFT_384426 [Pseudomassariella vexata]